ncbi:hypothetical protein LTR17_006633 [Elasticomyces elasticus]|nr:hypothetical protein LTR17_006633 [Elasticomyces elasticus]
MALSHSSSSSLMASAIEGKNVDLVGMITEGLTELLELPNGNKKSNAAPMKSTDFFAGKTSAMQILGLMTA